MKILSILLKAASMVLGLTSFFLMVSNEDEIFLKGLMYLGITIFVLILDFLLERYVLFFPKKYVDYYNSVPFLFAKLSTKDHRGEFSSFIQIKRILGPIYFKKGTPFYDYDENFILVKKEKKIKASHI